jgi:hypothetical protein
MFSNTQSGADAAGVCHQVAALFPDMFINFYSLKNFRNANNSTATKVRGKISADLESLEF